VSVTDPPSAVPNTKTSISSPNSDDSIVFRVAPDEVQFPAPSTFEVAPRVTFKKVPGKTVALDPIVISSFCFRAIKKGRM
jgi:hypothetical protein